MSNNGVNDISSLHKRIADLELENRRLKFISDMGRDLPAMVDLFEKQNKELATENALVLAMLSEAKHPMIGPLMEELKVRKITGTLVNVLTAKGYLQAARDLALQQSKIGDPIVYDYCSIILDEMKRTGNKMMAV